MSSNHSTTEITETRQLVLYGFELARHLNIRRIMVVSELQADRGLVDKTREEESVIWVVRDQESIGKVQNKGDHIVEIPHNPVGPLEQVSLALIIAVMKDYVDANESVLCLLSVAGTRRLDNLLIINPKRDFAWFNTHSQEDTKPIPISQEFVRLVVVALKFAAEGREGKPIGTIFLLGDIEELESIARPLILNPCKGHPKKSRSIYDNEFLETMREFSALDGAFLIDNKGVVEAAAVYLDAPVTKEVNIPKGLGSRHLAAAAATLQTNSLAIVISESSGTVTVFSKGSKVLSLSKPESRNS
jgi:diadenylate cyclase